MSVWKGGSYLLGKGFMPVRKGVHTCQERGPSMPGKESIPVRKRGSCLSGKGFMPVWKGVHTCQERGSRLS